MPFELDADHPGKIGLVNDLKHSVKIGMGLIPLFVEFQCLGANRRSMRKGPADGVVAVIGAKIIEVGKNARVRMIQFLITERIQSGS